MTLSTSRLKVFFFFKKILENIPIGNSAHFGPSPEVHGTKYLTRGPRCNNLHVLLN